MMPPYSLVSQKLCSMVSAYCMDGRDRPVIPRSLEAADELGSSRSVPQRSRTVARAGRTAEPASRKAGSARGGHMTERAGKVVGIDVAKAQLDGAVRPGNEQGRWGNDPAGIAQAVTWLCAVGPRGIGIKPPRGLRVATPAHPG